MILQLSDWIDWFILFYSHFGGGLMVALIFFCGGAYLNLASDRVVEHLKDDFFKLVLIGHLVSETSVRIIGILWFIVGFVILYAIVF